MSTEASEPMKSPVCSSQPIPVVVRLEPGFEAFRTLALRLLAAEVRPADVQWLSSGALSLFDSETPLPPTLAQPHLSRQARDLLRRVAHHRDEARGALLYRVLYRLSHGERSLLEVASDPDVVQLTRMDAAVRRAAHKTKAFVRFRRVSVNTDDSPPSTPASESRDFYYVAWHRPEHPILPLVAEFFKKRFSDMRWTIITPDASLSFDGHSLHFGPGQPRSAAPPADELEALWRSYYRATFNPARLMVKAMQAEMPKRHWTTLPETIEIPAMLREAQARQSLMLQATARTPTARRLIADANSPEDLRERAMGCAACPLHTEGTQTVFGEGPLPAPLMLVGEQPGDEEDLTGRPFVGPAGQELFALLAEVGLQRERLYITNAVKHFHHQLVPLQRGKRRLHAKPTMRHVSACRPWLLAELAQVQPQVVVCLGATAARSLLGVEVRIERDRGVPQTTPFGTLVITYHPSAVLRAPDPHTQHRVRSELIRDLTLAGDLAGKLTWETQ